MSKVIPILLWFLVGPVFAAERVTVQQLEHLVDQLHNKTDKEASHRLAECKLTERLSTARLDRLEGALPGERSRLALLAIADVSAFLDPPAGDVDSRPAPDLAIQKQIQSRAVDFVRATSSRMPNFLASRRVIRFQNAPVGLGLNIAVATPDVYHFIDSTDEAVRYRNGREEPDEPGGRGENTMKTGLITSGTFGPMLETVMHDILGGSIRWSRWETSPVGRVAVFCYTVPKDQATFAVTWCCIPDGSGVDRVRQATSKYHGEISVDPASGAITRFTILAEPNPAGFVSTADVLVEYGSVEIGGRTYQCPVRSATLLVAKSVILHRDSADFIDLTSVSDIRFDQYHVFRSEMKIVEP